MEDGSVGKVQLEQAQGWSLSTSLSLLFHWVQCDVGPAKQASGCSLNGSKRLYWKEKGRCSQCSGREMCLQFHFSCVWKLKRTGTQPLFNFSMQEEHKTATLILYWCILYLTCIRDCVQCKAFNRGGKKDTCEEECSHFSLIPVDHREKLPQPGQYKAQSHCKEKDIDDCWFYFTYSVDSNNNAIVHVVKTPGMFCFPHGYCWLSAGK